MKTLVLTITLIVSLISIGAIQAGNSGTIVDVKTAKEMLDQGALFIDVRSASRYKGGHIPGAINVDVWKNFNTEFVKVAKKDQEIVIYCNGVGCSRSPRAITNALAMGYENIYYFEEGWPAWLNAKYPKEK